MAFEVTKEHISQLHQWVEDGNDNAIKEALNSLYAVDVAEIFDELKIDDVVYIYRLLDDEITAEALVELDEDLQEKILTSLTSREIAEGVIENIDSDDAADVISGLPDKKKEEVIGFLDDEEQASDIIDLLNYPEGTAGAVMAKELIKVKENWSVGTCIREMRKQAEDLDNVYTIYVVDHQNVLKGRLSLKQLLFTSTSTRTRVSDIYNDEALITVEAETSAEDVSRIMEKYDLVVLPVVTKAGTLIGRITIDDVVDLIVEEAEKDYQLASGISEDVEARDSVWALTRARLPWLLIGMAGGIVGASIIGAFHIEEHPEMAIFIPLIAATGGNVGVQSAAIVVQGLANKSLRNEGLFKKLFKELKLGMVNGIICSSFILLVSLLLNFGNEMAFTASIALLIVIVFAALFGTFIPLILDRYKIDPALATGPFITTANDIIGLIIYFQIGKYILESF